MYKLEKHYIDCECDSSAHVLRFLIDDGMMPGDMEEQEPTLYVELQLNPHLPFWKKCITAIQYLFNKTSSFGYWDVVTLDRDAGNRLYILLHQYRAMHENYSQKKSNEQL